MSVPRGGRLLKLHFYPSIHLLLLPFLPPLPFPFPFPVCPSTAFPYSSLDLSEYCFFSNLLLISHNSDSSLPSSMAVSPQIFPPRKRRPSAGAFVSPKLTDMILIQSLLELSREITSLQLLRFLLKRSSFSIIRKSKLLSVLFEELLRNSDFYFPHSALLCFEEMYIVLQRIKTLIEDCSNGSKMWLLMQIESVENSFHELTLDLSTLLDILPVKEVDLSDEVEEIVVLIRKQSAKLKAIVDPRDDELKNEVMAVLDRIKKEIVPDNSKLKRI